MGIYNKENLLINLDSILPSGFSMNAEGIFIKQENGKMSEMTFAIDEYFPHEVNFFNLLLAVSFTEVEQILHEVLASHPNTGYPHEMSEAFTFDKSFANVLPAADYEKFRTHEVNSDTSFDVVKPYLNQMKGAALDFLNQHVTLLDFYNYAETLPINEMANFYRQPLTARRMIIKKLVNAPDYTTYANNLINHYSTVQPDVTKSVFLQALKTYLDAL